MWFYIKLAWRNILRNKRRTLIAGTAMGIGIAALIYTDALMIGMKDHLIHSGTASFLGEAQIHGAPTEGPPATVHASSPVTVTWRS